MLKMILAVFALALFLGVGGPHRSIALAVTTVRLNTLEPNNNATSSLLVASAGIASCNTAILASQRRTPKATDDPANLIARITLINIGADAREKVEADIDKNAVEPTTNAPIVRDVVSNGWHVRPMET